MKRYDMQVDESTDLGAMVEANESEHGEWVKHTDLPQWQPIATAPKDGTWVMLRGGSIDWQHVGDDGVQPPCVFARWAGGECLIGDEWVVTEYDTGVCSVTYENPTHWRPVPE